MIDTRRRCLALLGEVRPSDVSLVETGAAIVIVIARPAPSDLAPTMTIHEAAAASKTSSRIIRDAIRLGRLEASGTSRTRVIERAALLAWMGSRRVRVPSPDDALMQRAEEIAALTTDRGDGVDVASGGLDDDTADEVLADALEHA